MSCYVTICHVSAGQFSHSQFCFRTWSRPQSTRLSRPSTPRCPRNRSMSNPILSGSQPRNVRNSMRFVTAFLLIVPFNVSHLVFSCQSVMFVSFRTLHTACWRIALTKWLSKALATVSCSHSIFHKFIAFIGFVFLLVSAIGAAVEVVRWATTAHSCAICSTISLFLLFHSGYHALHFVFYLIFLRGLDGDGDGRGQPAEAEH
jgi:hypothetical protein